MSNGSSLRGKTDSSILNHAFEIVQEAIGSVQSSDICKEKWHKKLRSQPPLMSQSSNGEDKNTDTDNNYRQKNTSWLCAPREQLTEVCLKNWVRAIDEIGKKCWKSNFFEKFSCLLWIKSIFKFSLLPFVAWITTVRYVAAKLFQVLMVNYSSRTNKYIHKPVNEFEPVSLT